mmetsp:Transcript_14713/g.26534  ORF Transcript_14713/g.26534 Transcript_14713/m.26534 type:complete len:244 (-) Transcript_14713:727-1458(-)
MDSLHSLEGCTAGALEASEGDHKGCLPAADHTDWLMEDTLGAGCKVVVHHMRRHHKMLQGVAHSHRMHPQLPGEVPCTQVACMEGPDRNSPQGVGWHTPQTLTCMGLGMEVGTGAGWGKAPLVQLNTAGHMRWNKGHWGPMGWVGPQGACCSHTGPGPQASLQLCPVQSPQEGQPQLHHLWAMQEPQSVVQQVLLRRPPSVAVVIWPIWAQPLMRPATRTGTTIQSCRVSCSKFRFALADPQW